MKKFLLLLITTLSIFAIPHKTDSNFVYGIYKVGDKITAPGKEYLGIKDGMLVEVVDPKEWSKGAPILSDHMQKVFCIIKHTRDWKEDLRKASKSHGNPSDQNNYKVKRKKINFDELGNAIGDTTIDWKLRNETINLIDGTVLRKSILKNTSAMKKHRSFVCYDYNAITIGDSTVGSGGAYTTFAAAFADLGNLTGDVSFIQISNVIESATAGLTEDLNGYTLTITTDTPHNGNYNSGWVIDCAFSSNLWTFQHEGPGVTEICGLKILRSTATTSGRFAFQYSAITTAFTFNIYSNLINNNNRTHSFLRSDDPSVILHVYNNISWNGQSGLVYSTSDGNANSVVENNTFYSYTGNGIEVNVAVGGIFRNNICFDNGVDFNIGAGINLTGENNADSDGTGANGNWATGTNNQINQVAVNNFVSLNASSGDNFLKPSAEAVVATLGTIPTYATTLVDGVVWTSEIGAKSKAVVSTVHNLRKQKFSFPRTWQMFSKRKTRK